MTLCRESRGELILERDRELKRRAEDIEYAALK